jgi:hypothetical protein
MRELKMMPILATRTLFAGLAIMSLAAADQPPNRIIVIGTAPTLSLPADVRYVVAGECDVGVFRLEIAPVSPRDPALRSVAIVAAGRSVAAEEINRLRVILGSRRINYIAEGLCGSTDEPGTRFWIDLASDSNPPSPQSTTVQLLIVDGRVTVS